MNAFNSEKIKKMIEDTICHPYLEQHIERPELDIAKIDILLKVYDGLPLSDHVQYKQIIAVMLVQIALDTHDLVSNVSNSSTEEIQKQLYVLAGDYYSGLYYKTLADIEDIQFVKLLANSIKGINEEKMKLYHDELRSWQELISTLGKVESILFTELAKYYHFSKHDQAYISEYLLVNRLIKELLAMEANEFSYIEQCAGRHPLQLNEPSLVYSIEREIELRQEKLEHLQANSSLLFNQLKYKWYDKKILSAVEEG